MINNKINEEELEKVTGGETTLIIDPKGGLRDTIAYNVVVGAEYYAFEMVKRGMLAEIKSVLDSAAVHNEAWEKVNIIYQISAKQ